MSNHNDWCRNWSFTHVFLPLLFMLQSKGRRHLYNPSSRFCRFFSAITLIPPQVHSFFICTYFHRGNAPFASSKDRTHRYTLYGQGKTVSHGLCSPPKVHKLPCPSPDKRDDNVTCFSLMVFPKFGLFVSNLAVILLLLSIVPFKT